MEVVERKYNAAFVVNARDKEKYVRHAVLGALSQTYPCHIVFSDQQSKDRTWEVMEKTVAEAPRGADHLIEMVRCPIEGPYSMATHNRHVDWLYDLVKEDWIFQCSADDYSLPRRVEACMRAVAVNNCATVATNVYYSEPLKEIGMGTPMTQIPEGYVQAGYGLTKLVYGSAMAGFKRAFLQKVGPAPANCTMDVFLGYLAALDEGYYVVGDHLHVHQNVADVNNMGFQGKLEGAVKAGDAAQLARLNELNRFQLFELYYQTAVRAQKLYPLAHQDDKNAILQMMIDQAVGWYGERSKLHEQKITPGIL